MAVPPRTGRGWRRRRRPGRPHVRIAGAGRVRGRLLPEQVLDEVRRRLQGAAQVGAGDVVAAGEADLSVRDAVDKRGDEVPHERRVQVLQVLPVHRQRVRGPAAGVQERVHRPVRHHAGDGAHLVQQAVRGLSGAHRRARQARQTADHTGTHERADQNAFLRHPAVACRELNCSRLFVSSKRNIIVFVLQIFKCIKKRYGQPNIHKLWLDFKEKYGE